jgi:endonuclease/exonuclease/phosphatase family metal-dependent hydrolase
MMITCASWNINASRGMSEARLEEVTRVLHALDADVLCLQEVACSGDLFSRLRASLSYPHACCASSSDVGLSYTTAIFSVYPLRMHESDTWLEHLPYPQSVVRATLCDEGGEAWEIVSVHVPNGSAHGIKKIETFESLSQGVGALIAQGKRVVVAGDFNEPQEVLEGGTIRSFGVTWSRAKQVWHDGGRLRGEPRARWNAAVNDVLGEAPSSGLVHAVRACEGATWTHTYVKGDQQRVFDHILCAPHVQVLDVEVDASVCEHGASDHRLVRATLAR